MYTSPLSWSRNNAVGGGGGPSDGDGGWGVHFGEFRGQKQMWNWARENEAPEFEGVNVRSC